MFATMSDAHAEWHRNAGVPMGQPGCPEDACHLPDPYCWECMDESPDTCPECIRVAAEVAALPPLEPAPWPWGPGVAPPPF